MHERHYTLAQATAVRDWVAVRVGRIRDARTTLVNLGARAGEALSVLDGERGGTYPGREVARALVDLSLALGELEAVDIVLRDIDRGLIDFPALRDGEEVYLCWLVDEEEIGFWHYRDAGFAGRQPLP